MGDQFVSQENDCARVLDIQYRALGYAMRTTPKKGAWGVYGVHAYS